jgi:hypothetical protein
MRILGAEEDSPRIGTHQSLPILKTGLKDCANVANSRVIDQDIKPSFGSSYLLYRRFYLELFSHIKLLRSCVSSCGPNFACNPFSRTNPDITENDMYPVAQRVARFARQYQILLL